MLNIVVLIGSRALRPLLAELHILVKEIQGAEFSFEDLAMRLDGLHRFIHEHYDAGRPDAFADEAFRKFASTDEDVSLSSPLVFDGDELMYRVEDEFPIDGYVLHNREHIDRDTWERVYPRILKRVAELARTLSTQLVERFPNKELLQALSIFQVNYWVGPVAQDFDNCIDILVDVYGSEKTIVSGGVRFVPPLIEGHLLKAQAAKFKDVMSSLVPPIKRGWQHMEKEEAAKARASTSDQGEDEESISKSRKSMTAYVWAFIMKSSLKGDISQFVKLAIIMLIMPVSSVPAESLFSCMNFIKNDRRNRLGEQHLNTAVRLFTTRYRIDGFPYEKALDIFLG